MIWFTNYFVLILFFLQIVDLLLSSNIDLNVNAKGMSLKMSRVVQLLFNVALNVFFLFFHFCWLKKSFFTSWSNNKNVKITNIFIQFSFCSVSFISKKDRPTVTIYEYRNSFLRLTNLIPFLLGTYRFTFLSVAFLSSLNSLKCMIIATLLQESHF